MQNLKVYIFAILSMFIWSSSYIWYKEAYEYFQPISIVFFRLVFASIVLEVFCRTRKCHQKVERKDLLTFMTLAACDPFLYFLGESFGIQLISTSLASLIVSSIPIFMPIFALMFLREKISILGIVGIIISFFGLMLVILENLDMSGTLKGVGLMSLCIIAGVGYSIVAKKLTDKYSSFTIVKVQSQIAALYFLPLFIFFDFQSIFQDSFNIFNYVVIIKLSIFGSVIAYLMYIEVVKKIGANIASLFNNLVPIFTAILAYFIIDERMTLKQIIGTAIVIFGIVLTQIKSMKGDVCKT